MAVHIIIDGYNLIRNSPVLGEYDRQDIQLGRDALVDMLAAYKKIKPHRITVVFDGTHAPLHSSPRDRIKGIDVKFSRNNETADKVIQRMAAREREKALVVSSDRAVAAAASSSRSAVIDSRDFEDRLLLAESANRQGDMEESSGWNPSTKKQGPRKRLPKRARRNRAKTRKL